MEKALLDAYMKWNKSAFSVESALGAVVCFQDAVNFNDSRQSRSWKRRGFEEEIEYFSKESTLGWGGTLRRKVVYASSQVTLVGVMQLDNFQWIDPFEKRFLTPKCFSGGEHFLRSCSLVIPNGVVLRRECFRQHNAYREGWSLSSHRTEAVLARQPASEVAGPSPQQDRSLFSWDAFSWSNLIFTSLSSCQSFLPMTSPNNLSGPTPRRFWAHIWRQCFSKHYHLHRWFRWWPPHRSLHAFNLKSSSTILDPCSSHPLVLLRRLGNLICAKWRLWNCRTYNRLCFLPLPQIAQAWSACSPVLAPAFFP